MTVLASWAVVLGGLLAIAAAMAVRARRRDSRAGRIVSALIAWVPLTVLGWYGMLGVVGTVSEGVGRYTMLILFGLPIVLLPHAYLWLGRKRFGLGATLVGLTMFGASFVTGYLLVVPVGLAADALR